jgi:hypothetical protein
MSCRILEQLDLVVAPSNHPVFVDEDSPYGDLILLKSFLSLFKRFAHEKFIIHYLRRIPKKGVFSREKSSPLLV